MLNKQNILDIIAEHKKEIDQLEYEVEQARQSCMEQDVKSMKDRLSYLRGNLSQYELQAKTWKLID